MGVGAKMAKEPWGGLGLSFPALPLGLCRPAAAAVAAPLPMPPHGVRRIPFPCPLPLLDRLRAPGPHLAGAVPARVAVGRGTGRGSVPGVRCQASNLVYPSLRPVPG